jgi:serine protease Do
VQEREAMEVKGPAERGGVKRGDVVLAIDGTAVHAPRELELMIARKAPGSRAELSVRRNGEREGAVARDHGP